ncbi:CDP-alcohol phosphatidyltransferase family protein [Patescibacteria group bacterium]|nr:CDP-alcohol phosphatidyltransferase family protein [Patescibacteria group bacterium]
MNWQHLSLSLLTLSRIPLAFGTASFLVDSKYLPALAVFLIAVATDWFDGFLARKFHLETALGEKKLEPLADSLLVFIPLLTLIYLNAISLRIFLFFCLIGLVSQITKLNYNKYRSRIESFQIIYLFSAQTLIALWLAEKVGAVWVIATIVIYLIAAFFKKSRLGVFVMPWKKKKPE